MEMILKIAAPVFAALVLLTNMITEAIKKVKPGVNAKVVALTSAIILSVLSCISAAFYIQVGVWYYYIVAAVVGVLVGFIVAQVAETGYDGAYMELIEILKQVVKAVLGSKELSKADCEIQEEPVASCNCKSKH